MKKKRRKYDQWLQALGKYDIGEGICPHCKSHDLKLVTIVSDVHKKIAECQKTDEDAVCWGILYCQDCKRGFWISRMRISIEEIEKGLEDGSVRTEPPEGITIL